MLTQQYPKVTFKSVEHFPDLVIREAICETNVTWDQFLKSFGVDLAKVAPGQSFVVKSRKGGCRLGDKIESIASKYTHKYRMLVTVEKEPRKWKPSKKRNRKLVPDPFPSSKEMPTQRHPPHHVPVTSNEMPLEVLAHVAAGGPMPLELLADVAANGSMPPECYWSTQPPPPPRSNKIFETRVEKIDNYNVIQRSSVIWPIYGPPPPAAPQFPTMRCFSMNDDQFVL